MKTKLIGKIGAMLAIAVIHTNGIAQTFNPTNSVPAGPPQAVPLTVSDEDQIRTIIVIASEAGKGFDPEAHFSHLKQNIDRLVAELLSGAAKAGPDGKPSKRNKAGGGKRGIEARPATTNALPVTIITDDSEVFVPPVLTESPVPAPTPDSVRRSLTDVEASVFRLRNHVEAVLVGKPSAKDAK